MAAVPATNAFGDSKVEAGENVAFGSTLADIKLETTRVVESSDLAAEGSFGTMSDCPDLNFVKMETIEDLETTAGDADDVSCLPMNDGEEVSSVPASSGHVQQHHHGDGEEIEIPASLEMDDDYEDADLDMDEDNASLCTSASQEERELQDAGIRLWDLKRRARAKINNMDEGLLHQVEKEFVKLKANPARWQRFVKRSPLGSYLMTQLFSENGWRLKKGSTGSML